MTPGGDVAFLVVADTRIDDEALVRRFEHECVNAENDTILRIDERREPIDCIEYFRRRLRQQIRTERCGRQFDDLGNTHVTDLPGQHPVSPAVIPPAALQIPRP